MRYTLAKFMGRMAGPVAKLGPGAGTSFPGIVFLKIAGYDALKQLASELKIGSILITGTNGKTTTTTLLIKLFSKELDIRGSYESNTVTAITTGLLQGRGDIGVFEYGIRDKKHGMPDTIQELIGPVGVVYTTISREHAQVAGVKNPFNQYLEAKTLLTDNMNHGVIVTNADDPRTANIGLNKSKDIKVNYYGVDDKKISDIFEDETVECPNCGNPLEYSHKFMNHRGLYKCPDCGLERPQLNVRLKSIEFEDTKWLLNIEGNLFNYTVNKDVSFKLHLKVPPFGFHNVYNTLASITAFATFTPNPDNIEKTAEYVFNNLDMSFIPPGRFEVVNINGKKVGLGQGDNYDYVIMTGCGEEQAMWENIKQKLIK